MTTPLDIALDYIDRGWSPIYVPHCSKIPPGTAWQRHRLTRETAPHHWNGTPANIGVLLGEPSGGLVDVDVDAPEAVSLASHFLPATGAGFGRASKPRSHWLYRAETPAKTKQWRDPRSPKDRVGMMVELRSDGAQTVFPGSTHESGEPIAWADYGTPTALDADALRDACGRLAAASLLARYWPGPGARHDAALGLAGGLIRAGWLDADAAAFIGAVATAAGDNEVNDRVRAVQSTLERQDSGGNTYGWRSLATHVGREVVAAVRRWLAARGVSGAATPDDDGERVTIQCSTRIDRMTDAAAEALRADDGIYQRAGRLVQLVRLAEHEQDALARTGTPTIRELANWTLRERLCRLARFVKYDPKTDTERSCSPPTDVVGALSARSEWSGVRPLAGLIETPSLRPDGTVIAEPGYDSATGYVYVPSCEFPPVPESPTQPEANAALAALCEPWLDFPWASDAAGYVPLAAALTIIARPAIQGPVPAFATDGNVRGGGKTLANDVAIVIGTGRAGAKVTFASDEVELEKVLSSYALRGAAVVCYDNANAPLAGAPLDKVLTAWPSVELRVLGRSEIATMRWNAVVLASGNNISIEGDTVRRVLVARIEHPDENPETRTDFRHPELSQWVEAERPRLVAAALTVLRGYVAAGRPSMGLGTWGSYEAWSRLVPPAIAWAGGPNVLACRASERDGGDSEKDTLRAILAGLPRLSPEPITVRSMLSALYPSERLRGQPCPPDGHDDLRAALESLVPCRPGQAPDGHRLGKALQRLRGRVVGGRRLDVVQMRNVRGWVVR